MDKEPIDWTILGIYLAAIFMGFLSVIGAYTLVTWIV